jgi:hypothetical protein
MNVSRVVFIKRHGLEEDVVACHLGRVVTKISYLIDFLAYFKGIWVHLLANFALKPFPVERSNVLQSR